MDDYTSWIGTRWEARCQMRLPKGNVGVGDTFTYDAACAALKLNPLSWEQIGNAVQLAAPPGLADTVAGKLKRADKADQSRSKTGFAFTSNPLEIADADLAPADDAAPVAVEVDG